MLLYFRKDLQAVFRLVPYEDKALLGTLSKGTVIWTDMDRLTVADIEMAADLSRKMRQEQPNVAQLNHPRESLQRFDLLRKLFADGINDFRVYRPETLPDDIRFPVFLRDETGAAYETPRLLQNYRELDNALAGLPGMRFVRPMIAEFGSKPGSDGYYRKYSAYRIGGRSYAQHCFAKQEWFIKDPGRGIPKQHLDDHRAYVRENPHRLSLMPIFDKASITYGRIDYTVLDDRIQVFEINTNPTVLSYPPTPFDEYDSTPYASMHADALLALPHARDSSCPARIDETHSEILAGLRREYGKRRRKLIVKKGLRFVRNAVLGEKV
ncbi:hypothetical protein MESS4_310061 [Mesorhizobium sp. STM 4661]|nr:hypothetical protein MESS4_310061 [Mesorhizobium sp. STM 4661]